MQQRRRQRRYFASRSLSRGKAGRVGEGGAPTSSGGEENDNQRHVDADAYVDSPRVRVLGLERFTIGHELIGFFSRI